VRALVTGASGFIGANLIRELLDEGHEVRALVRPTSDLRGLDGLPAQRVVGDVMDPASLRRATDGCDVVFHAAAVFSYWGHSDEDLRTVSVDGTRNVLEAAALAGVRRLVLTSSSVTLGSGTHAISRDETSNIRDDEPAPAYFHVKAAQERAAVEAARELGVELVVACPTIVVGSHDYRGVPSTAIILDYLRDPWRATFPGGCNVVHVRDVARGHLLLADRGRPGQRYVLGSENVEWSLLHRMVGELAGVGGPGLSANRTTSLIAAVAAEAVAGFTGNRPLVTRGQARSVGRFYWYSHARAAALGYQPRPAREALKLAIAWLLRSQHVTREMRLALRPAPEVVASLDEAS
jgi:dihydroflavonol-4-reductase